MAERKRGLGRGLGALIPDVVSEERPVDVFFPENSDVSRETARKRLDPAAGMAQSRRTRKTTGTAAKKKTGTAATAKDEPKSKSGAGRGAKTASTAKSRPTAKPTGEAKAPAGTKSTANAKPNSDTKAASSSQAEAESSDVSRETQLLTVPGVAFGLIPLEQIKANAKQPRTVFDEDALDELVESIKTVGVLQPIVVRVADASAPEYELIMGERRLRASKEAGLSEIPAIIRDVSDDDMLRDALLENLHRADLNPLEEAAAYQQLLDDFQCTQEELSKRLGRSRPQITNTLRLLKLPSLVQRRVAAGVISQGHARALLGLSDGGAMEALAQRVVSEGLSVRATEEAVVLLNRGEKPRVSRETKKSNPELVSIAQSMGDRLDTRVSIVMGKRKGKISVEFANEGDLGRILKALGMQD